MFGFIKKVFVIAISFFSFKKCILKCVLKFVSMNNREYKVRPETININSN